MTPKQQDIANRFLFKVASLGYKITRSSADGLMQAATPSRNRRIEFKMDLPYGDHIAFRIDTAFTGKWTPGRKMTIEEFENIKEADVASLVSQMDSCRAEIKETRLLLKDLQGKRADEIANKFNKL